MFTQNNPSDHIKFWGSLYCREKKIHVILYHVIPKFQNTRSRGITEMTYDFSKTVKYCVVHVPPYIE